MGDVVNLDMVTRLDLPPDRILEAAKGQLETVAIFGWDHDGNLYAASNKADGGDLLWLMEKAKALLLSMGED